MSSVRKPRTAVPVRTQRPPPGKHVMPALDDAPSGSERALLEGLDADRINHLAECLFTLNGRRFGAIPGAYVVVCTQPGERWCVAQLRADRGRPLELFDALSFTSPAAARRAAERLRRERGERTPKRSI
ncbi:MAG: hypothetical protein RLW62_16670 [Gammaproteobacteria bacterium]